MDHFSGTDKAHPLRRMTAAVSELLKEVEDVDPVFMSPGDRAEVLAELAAATDRLHLINLRVMQASGDLGADAGFKDVAAWQQATQRRDVASARRDLRLAEALAERWPATAAAVRDGRASLEQARRIVRALDNLVDALEAEWAETLDRAADDADDAAADHHAADHDEQQRVTRAWIDDTVARAEARLIELAADHTPTELDRLGERILTAVAPAHADELQRRALERAERRARSETRLSGRDRGDGSVRLSGIIPSSTWAMLESQLGSFTSPRVNAGGVDPWIDPDTGRRVPHDRRLGQAFVALLERVTSHHLPQQGGLGTSVVVTIDFESLRDGVGQGTIGDPDGEGTTLSVGDVRRLACASGIIPAVLGSPSVLLDLGRTSRLFTSSQRRAHGIHHKTCEAAGCSVPSTMCDAHHKRDPWSLGGTTDQADLGFLCWWHHHRAHDPTYRTTWSADGVRFHRRR